MDKKINKIYLEPTWYLEDDKYSWKLVHEFVEDVKNKKTGEIAPKTIYENTFHPNIKTLLEAYLRRSINEDSANISTIKDLIKKIEDIEYNIKQFEKIHINNKQFLK